MPPTPTSEPSRPTYGHVPAANRFGAHMPSVGSLHTALEYGKAVGCGVVQVFTKNPQQWRAPKFSEADTLAFLKAQDETGIPCLSSHDTFLINPASENPELLQKSREALVDEMQRSAGLRIPFVVMHQGVMGKATEEEALARLAESVRMVLEQSPEDGPILLLETVAGQGTSIGHQFEHMRYVLDTVDAGDRLGICLDTCHIFAAGYDFRDEATYAATMAHFDEVIGLHRVRMIHANDSKKELNCRVDRHEHIGQGHIGLEGFRLLLTDPRLADVPVVLETPKLGEMDPVNLLSLRTAAGVVTAD